MGLQVDESRSRDYIEHGLWINRTIIDVFDEHVKNVPDKTLLIAAGGIRWTYKEVAKKVEILAANLACLGVGHGDVVSAQLPNWGEFRADPTKHKQSAAWVAAAMA